MASWLRTNASLIWNISTQGHKKCQVENDDQHDMGLCMLCVLHPKGSERENNQRKGQWMWWVGKKSNDIWFFLCLKTYYFSVEF